MSRGKLLQLLVAINVLTLLLSARSVEANTYSWASTGGTAWSTASNWGGTACLYRRSEVRRRKYSSSNSVLTVSSSVNAIWDTGAGNMTISSTGSGVVLTLMGTANIGGTSGIGLEMDSSAGSLVISTALALFNSQTWFNNAFASALIVSGSISGSGKVLTLSGSGTDIFSGTNNLTSGTINVAGAGGTLKLGNSAPPARRRKQ